MPITQDPTEMAEPAPLHARTFPVQTPSHRPPLGGAYNSTPAFQSPIRQHRRHPSTPRLVKTTLNARTEYSTSSDDGHSEHRINQYVIKEEIGRGSFGAVHLAVDNYGTEFAVKEFSKSRLRKRAQSHVLRLLPGAKRRPGHLALGEGRIANRFGRHSTSSKLAQEESGNPLQLIEEEIAVMKKLNHPNLVALYEVLDDPGEDSLYMVLEMCKKGVVMKVSVDERADPYDDETCRHFFRDLLLGIEYLHAQGVVHRDIKPDNCLLTHDDVLKIVDFGVSEMFEKESEMMTAKSAGSPAFLPPELCVAKHGDVSGKAADLWSLGATLFCLRFGRIPFEKGGFLDLYEAIRTEDVVFDFETSPEFEDLMRRVLEKDPARRIRMAELREHPWVTRHGTDSLLSTEENTADLVEPPTDAEMKSAITSNLRYLIAVMKAVKKFKRLLSVPRASVEGSKLAAAETKPQSRWMPASESPSQHPFPPSPPPMDVAPRRSRSESRYDRQAVEHDLVVQGVHHQHHLRPTDQTWRPATLPPTDVPMPDLDGHHPVQAELESSTAPSPDGHGFGYGHGRAQPRPIPSVHDHPIGPRSTRTVTGKGQAHDPREDAPLLLDVGPGDPDEGAAHVISESPSGTDIDIYEAAYRQEVERIQLLPGRQPTVYLTRQVERGKEADEGGLSGRPKIQWGHLLEKAKEKAKDSMGGEKE
ncbi:MAG: hypothetical protein M1826_003518 [Phylliscum demangeonii]|nr:MAG: hypothetical protein M1826_003518 [Phylliscum demangeonii]